MTKPKVVLVPFTYPDYPEDVVRRFIERSKDTVARIHPEVVTVDKVASIEEALRARRRILEEDADLIIALLVSWVEAPNLVACLRDFLSKPILLWSHTTYKENGVGLTLGAIPAAGVIRQTLDEMGARFRFTYGMPDSARVRSDIESAIRVAGAVGGMGRSRIGLFGYVSMGMYPGGFDHAKVRRELGPEIVHLDQYMIMKRADAVADADVADLVRSARSNWDLSSDVTEANLVRTMKVYRAIRELCTENQFDAVTVKCQYEMSREYGLAPCIPLSMLGDELPTSCEGDVPLILSQVLLGHISSGKTTSYGDVHDALDDGILLAACGFAPISQALGRPQVKAHTALYEGLMNSSPYVEGTVTLARIASDGPGYKMHIARGRATVMPPFHEIECPTYAGMRVVMDGSVDHFMQNLASQHYGIVYGDYLHDLVEFCRMKGIRAIVS